MNIPIQNLYYMLCYAWGNLASLQRVSNSSDVADNIQNLLARVLIECVEDLLKRGLWRDYVEYMDEIAGLRGKLAVTETFQKGLLRLGRTVCSTDEYCLNNRLNQIVVSTVAAMSRIDGVDSGLCRRLAELTKHFSGVLQKPVSTRDFLTVKVHRLNRHYVHALRVCELIWAQLVPAECAGRFSFEAFDRDEGRMRKVFEGFIRNFFRIEATGFDEVKSERLRWNTAASNGEALLPIMITDTSLISSSDYVVMETKFVPRSLQSSHGSDKLRSGHLYQLMAYLENIRRKSGASPRGILLYPKVDRGLEEKHILWGLEVQVRTIDLYQPWEGLKRDLLMLVAA